MRLWNRHCWLASICACVLLCFGCKHEAEELIPPENRNELQEWCEENVASHSPEGLEMSYPASNGYVQYHVDLDVDGENDVTFSLIRSSTFVSHQLRPEYKFSATGLNGLSLLKVWDGSQGYGPCTAGCDLADVITRDPITQPSNRVFESSVWIELFDFLESGGGWLSCSAIHNQVGYIGFKIGPEGDQRIGFFRISYANGVFRLDHVAIAHPNCDRLTVIV